MGRELKRVPLDFSWPLDMPWKGYMNPFTSQECKPCDRTGLNPATKKIDDDFYDFEGSGRRWNDKITQDEVKALVREGRLMNWTHTCERGKGWTVKDPPYMPTAEEVNLANGPGKSILNSHDAINRGILVETRAKRLGVYGRCVCCDGHGEIWFSEEIRQRADDWYEKEKYDPPTGEGWQLWEAVSEGSPISPVFPTREAFVAHLVREGATPKAAEAFAGSGWAPSAVSDENGLRSGVNALDPEANAPT